MQRLACVGLCVAIVAICARNLSGEPPAGATKPTADTFQGVWLIESVAYGPYEWRGTTRPIRMTFEKGQVVTQPAFGLTRNIDIKFDSNQGQSDNSSTSFTWYDKPRTESFRASFAPNPVEIELTEKVGNRIDLRRGICRLTGETLEICLGRLDAQPPRQFEATEETMLLRLRRPDQKPKQ